jgi:hypothetical protein
MPRQDYTGMALDPLMGILRGLKDPNTEIVPIRNNWESIGRELDRINTGAAPASNGQTAMPRPKPKSTTGDDVSSLQGVLAYLAKNWSGGAYEEFSTRLLNVLRFGQDVALKAHEASTYVPAGEVGQDSFMVSTGKIGDAVGLARTAQQDIDSRLINHDQCQSAIDQIRNWVNGG